MRGSHDIQLNDRTSTTRQLEGEAIVYAGRYLIAKTLKSLRFGMATTCHAHVKWVRRGR